MAKTYWQVHVVMYKVEETDEGTDADVMGEEEIKGYNKDFDTEDEALTVFNQVSGRP